MARRIVQLSHEYPYHISARSNNRDWFAIPLQMVFEIYADWMEKTIKQYKIECHAFVLMANHFHLLLSTPLANLSLAMRYFMTETSRAIARASNRINRIYGARYHWTIIRDSEHYAHAFYYVYRNPIKHKICKRLEEYNWSTYHPHHTKFRSLLVPKLHEYEDIFQCV